MGTPKNSTKTDGFRRSNHGCPEEKRASFKKSPDLAWVSMARKIDFLSV
jgi:hypothetical protein